MPAITTTPNLSLPAAQRALAAAQQVAQSISVPMNIAIVDASLYLLAFARMPGAKLTSVDLAINKAFTAAGHRAGTHTYKERLSAYGAPMMGVHNSNGGRFTTIGGGLPIEVDGVVVGAIGCSAGTPDQDMKAAQAGLDAIAEMIRREGRAKL